MRFSLFSIIATATVAYASPVNHELALRNEPKALARRDTTVDFALDRQFKEQTLFHGRVGTANGNVDLDVECVDCWTTGTVTVTATDHDIVKPHLRFDFHGVTAHADLHVTATGVIVYTVTLFQTETPLGVGVGHLDIGVMCFVDLVFILTDSIDFKGGFEVTLPETATLEVDLSGGDIINQSFDGTLANALPIEVTTGDATFKADLRLRVQAGFEAQTSDLPFGSHLPNFGGGAIMALYANIAEFEAQLVSSETCALEAHEWFDINVGAFASVGANLNYITMSEAPTVSTTLFSSPTQTQCLDGILPVDPPVPTDAAATPYPVPPVDIAVPVTSGLPAETQYPVPPVDTPVSPITFLPPVETLAPTNTAEPVPPPVETPLPPVGTPVSTAYPVPPPADTVAPPADTPLPPVDTVVPVVSTSYQAPPPIDTAAPPADTGYPVPPPVETAYPTPTVAPNPACTGAPAYRPRKRAAHAAPAEVYTIHQCAALVPNCPASLIEKVVATALPGAITAKVANKVPSVNSVHVERTSVITLSQIAPMVKRFDESEAVYV